MANRTGDGEDSDDSLVGEHSPFLRATRSRFVVLVNVGLILVYKFLIVFFLLLLIFIQDKSFTSCFNCDVTFDREMEAGIFSL